MHELKNTWKTQAEKESKSVGLESKSVGLESVGLGNFIPYSSRIVCGRGHTCSF